MVMEMLANASIVGKLGVLVALFPLAAALLYVMRPSERLLALMRPLSLVAIFGGLTSATSGLANVLYGISATGTLDGQAWRGVAAGTAESIIGLFVAFACLTIAWLLVTLGMRRTA